MLGEVPGLSNALEAALSSQEYRVRQLVPGTQRRLTATHRYEIDLASPEALRELHAELSGPEGRQVGAIFNFLGLAEPFSRGGCNLEGSPLPLLEWLFLTFKEFESDLRTSARRGGGWLFNFTSMDGNFGLDGGPVPVAQAATVGMFKTLQREWPETRVKSIDLAPEADAQLLFSRLFAELEADDRQVEVGITETGRWRLALVPESLPAQRAPLALGSDAVVLITGGAYGITAEAAKLLARRYRPRLVLVGRSPLPGPEPPELAAAPNKTALRRVLIEQMRRENPAVPPAKVERALVRLMKDRQIRENLAAMRQAGATVEYHALDVRDRQQFGALIDTIYARHGRLDGVLHGAGVIADNLLAQKSPTAFTDVVSTKVESARILVEKLRSDSLQFLVLFSSISGRFGNAGQIDYSAANEYLNKLAVHLQSQWPGRVVAINWGPWDGGMVSEELRRLYRNHAIEPIPLAAGCQALLDELSPSSPRRPEIVLACSLPNLVKFAGVGVAG